MLKDFDQVTAVALGIITHVLIATYVYVHTYIRNGRYQNCHVTIYVVIIAIIIITQYHLS